MFVTDTLTETFRPLSVDTRVERLTAHMGEQDEADRADALLVTNLGNIRYLTGFTGSAARLLVTGDGLTFVTDGRYGQQAEAQLGAAGVKASIEVSSREQKEALAAAVQKAGIRRLGLEAASVTWAAQRTYTDWFEGVELVPTSGLVEKLRQIKDPGELDRLRAAAAIADRALAEVRHRLAEGPTEAELALELDTTMRRMGADDVSFETIVATGPNGARPHHRPGPRPIAPGDLVVIDFGALVEGYHSDMTRTFMVGEMSDTQHRMYAVVQEAQAAGVAAVRPGTETVAVDAACREVIAEAGWAEAFLHSTGHGVGLDIHEAPSVAVSNPVTLEEGHVITVEPGVYLADHGGVRIEDTVVVTEDGCRPLTLTAKDPTVTSPARS